MNETLDERLDELLGQVFAIKDDMRGFNYLLKELELLHEYKGNEEKRYITKALLLMSHQIEQDVDAAAESIDEIAK